MSQGGFFSSDELAEMSSGHCPPAPADYRLPTRFPDLRSAGRISFDWETKDPKLADYGNGVYRKDGKLVGGAIAAWDKAGKLFHAEYYPFAHRNGPNLDKSKVIQYFADQLNFYEGELTGANLLYDGDWAQSDGITPVHAKWRDVQWAEALMDEMAFNYKLETLGQKYIGIGKTTEGLRSLYGTDYIKRFDEVHPGHAREYGIGDVLLPNAILNKQYVELERLGMVDLFHLESRLTPFLLYLRRQGVRIDMEAAMGFKGFLEQKRDENLKAITDLCGIQFTTENSNNKKLLEHVFERVLGIPLPRTKASKTGKGGGEVSITDAWLEQCKHPIGKLLLGVNKYTKAKGTFVDGYVFDYAVNGRIHGDFHPLRKADDAGENGTESGRLSGSNPNLQNIPVRDKEIGPRCRGMFIPEEGAQWWAADYSQIEYRMLVHMASIMPPLKGSGEDAVRRQKSLESVKAVIRLYTEKPDTDFHQALADLVTKVLGKDFPRKQAKNLNFGLVYGMGLQKLATDLNMLDEHGKPNKDVEPLMNTYHGSAPFVKDLYDLCIHNVATTGEIRTILNRRSQFDFWQPRFRTKGVDVQELPYDLAVNAYGFEIQRCQTHKALNRLLQGSAADLMKLAMVSAYEAGVFSSTKDFTCSLTVHDELDGSIFPTKRGRECYDELVNIMQTCMPLNLPVLASSDIAANWAEAK